MMQILLFCLSVSCSQGLRPPGQGLVGHPSMSFSQNASKASRPEVTAAVSSDEVCFGDREKEEPPSPIEASPTRSFLEKVSKKKTPKTVKMPKPSKVPKPPKPPKPPKSLKLKDGGKKKGKKCRGPASPTIPNLDLLEAHTKEALTKIEPPKKGKVGSLTLCTCSQCVCRHLWELGLWVVLGLPCPCARLRAAGLWPSKLVVVAR